MDKKYELLKDSYWYRVKALKDFTLITGETIKKSDVGGCVDSEDCLSQEGLCWVKDDAYVKGSVSENAIVRDNGFVGENAIVTGNAVVQAYQYITFGTVTTDLLGTKDWIGALYAELGIKPENGKITLYKRVWSTDDPKVFESDNNRKFIYEIGKEAIEIDVDEDAMKVVGKGLHFSILKLLCFLNHCSILECEINVEDILTVMNGVVRARKCKVIRAYEEG